MAERIDVTGASSLVTPIRRSTFAVENVHSVGLGVRSFAPGADPELFAKSKALFDLVMSTPAGQPNLDGWETESAFANRAQMVVAANGNNPAGMLLYHPDARGDVLVRSLVVDSDWSGMRLGTAMIAAAVEHAPTVFGMDGLYRCSVREKADGELNWAQRPVLREGRVRVGARTRDLLPRRPGRQPAEVANGGSGRHRCGVHPLSDHGVDQGHAADGARLPRGMVGGCASDRAALAHPLSGRAPGCLGALRTREPGAAQQVNVASRQSVRPGRKPHFGCRSSAPAGRASTAGPLSEKATEENLSVGT